LSNLLKENVISRLETTGERIHKYNENDILTNFFDTFFTILMW